MSKVDLLTIDEESVHALGWTRESEGGDEELGALSPGHPLLQPGEDAWYVAEVAEDLLADFDVRIGKEESVTRARVFPHRRDGRGRAVVGELDGVPRWVTPRSGRGPPPVVGLHDPCRLRAQRRRRRPAALESSAGCPMTAWTRRPRRLPRPGGPLPRIGEDCATWTGAPPLMVDVPTGVLADSVQVCRRTSSSTRCLRAGHR